MSTTLYVTAAELLIKETQFHAWPTLLAYAGHRWKKCAPIRTETGTLVSVTYIRFEGASTRNLVIRLNA